MRSVYGAVIISLLFSLSNAWAQVGDNTALNLAWHEASDAVFARGFPLLAGIDIDQDGKGEILTYDGDFGGMIVYLFEASGDNNYEIIWQFQFSDGTLGLVGGERGIMVTDIDNDGFSEITVIVDSEDPATTNGFNAGHIFEWDGTDNGIPSTPTATFDPPRDSLDQIKLEYNSTALDLDNDGKTELLLTHRGGNGTFLSIVEISSADLSGGVTLTTEFEDKFPDTDATHFQARNIGFGITDIDLDGLSEILMFDVNTGFVRVFENTGPDAYTFVNEWQPNPAGWVAGATVNSLIPEADFDNDGVKELYLSDTKGNSWIITPGGDVATMFDDANWTKLHDWKVGNIFNEGGSIRDGIVGDVDRDNKPDIYLAGNNFASILDIEYDGGDVTVGSNYSYFVTAIDANDVVDGGHFARPVKLALSDMDNDGHHEVVVIVPWSGGNPVNNLLGLYVFEHEAGLLSMNLSKTWADPGDTVTVEVSISNPDSLEIGAIEIDVFFDETILAFDTTDRDSTSIIRTGWLFEDNLNTGTVAVAAASDSAFNESGNLYLITFIVSDNANDNDKSLLTFGNITLNAGSPTVDSLMNGFIQVVVAGGDVDSNLSVQAFDASRILKSLSDTSIFSLWQQLEADVSDNNAISSFDASLILQFVVGSISEFPSQPDAATAAPAFGSLALTEHIGSVGEEVVIPINGVNLSSVFSGSFNLQHDSEILIFKEVRTTEATDGYLTASRSSDGEIVLYMAGAHSVDGDRTLLEVVYTRLNEATTSVILHSADLNDNLIWTTGDTTIVEIVVSVENEQLIPKAYELSQNYPNPFNPTTTIRFALPITGDVLLTIYNLRGEEVFNFANDSQPAGYHEISWDGSRLSSGIYFYRLQAGDFFQTRKMVLLK